jgi:hypothetical protein
LIALATSANALSATLLKYLSLISHPYRKKSVAARRSRRQRF